MILDVPEAPVTNLFPVGRPDTIPDITDLMIVDLGIVLGTFNRKTCGLSRPEGIELSLSTLADQVGVCATVLRPLHELIERHVLSAERLHSDDTTVPILAKGHKRRRCGPRSPTRGLHRMLTKKIPKHAQRAKNDASAAGSGVRTCRHRMPRSAAARDAFRMCSRKDYLRLHGHAFFKAANATVLKL